MSQKIVFLIRTLKEKPRKKRRNEQMRQAYYIFLHNRGAVMGKVLSFAS